MFLYKSHTIYRYEDRTIFPTGSSHSFFSFFSSEKNLSKPARGNKFNYKLVTNVKLETPSSIYNVPMSLIACWSLITSLGFQISFSLRAKRMRTLTECQAIKESRLNEPEVGPLLQTSL